MAFQTAQDYLEYLVAKLADLPLDPPDEAWLKEIEKRRQEISPHEEFDPELLSRGELLVRSLKESVLDGLSADVRSAIDGTIAIGAVRSGQANAMIIKSEDKKYAILVYTGLPILLSKLYKYAVGVQDPSLVTYCNRADPRDLTSADYGMFGEELIDTQRRTGIPRGSMVMIAPEGMSRYAHALKTAEMFILCHEIAHFLNGDLDDETHLASFHGIPGARQLIENRDHEMEYRADAVGFQLLLHVLQADERNGALELAFHSVASLFEILFQVHGGESASHPNPRARTMRLASRYFNKGELPAVL